MTFTSPEFLAFLVVVYAAFLAIRRYVRLRNVLLLIASYVFYGWGSPELALLLLGSTILAFVSGLLVAASASEASARLVLALGVGGQLTILVYFKYANFCIDAFVKLSAAVGLHVNVPSLNVLLPIGISFFTFQGIAYVVDIYRKDIVPERSVIVFALFKAYFPQLVAGPIERPAHMLPQFHSTATIARDDIWQALAWIMVGYFHKVVIADTMAGYVDHAFTFPFQPMAGGATCLLAVFAFGLQIYGDFAGYSLIARGLAKLMGFDLVENFRRPYLATSPRDFWRRWHISLSQWLRDYLYIPLGGSAGSPSRTRWNLLATMGLGGLWHGASWNFVFWGLFHGVLLSIQHAIGDWRAAVPRWLRIMLSAIGTAILIHIGWLLFRVQDLDQLARFTANIWSNFTPDFTAQALLVSLISAQGAVALLDGALYWSERRPDRVKIMVMAAFPFILALILANLHAPVPFIYFRF